ncbi:hypothetical protein FRUB_06436 [Fimbriiglobus ruber]|uniref:Uncharacterized protein n=1 Tax=Fimbriiglobus ruber TaxID=1908690 RepID=A0A225DIM3_9BACT|nr:hypothetical protein FRUB_06436 [Fimbriiglobus ruber]
MAELKLGPGFVAGFDDFPDLHGYEAVAELKPDRSVRGNRGVCDLHGYEAVAELKPLFAGVVKARDVPSPRL